MRLSKYVLFFVFIVCANSWAQGVLQINVTSKRSPILGRLRDFTFQFQNKTSKTIAILEIRPAQPCEDPISLIRPLYGQIEYDQKSDAYIHDSIPQMQSQISLIEGLLLPDESLSLPVQYRPYAPTELVTITYATVGTNKIYRLKKQAGSRTIFATDGSNDRKVLLPQLFRMPQAELRTSIVFENPIGKANKYCFCETLNAFVNTPPYSLYKEWDAGKSAQFRVGEKQEGSGPDRHSAGWKFLDQYDVFYGDGMYTQGEFIEIAPDQAADFMAKVKKKYSMKKVEYFFDRAYYDLEPLP